MICRFIDTHCHFDFPPFSGDEEASLQRAAQAGVGKIIVPATEAENFARVQALAEKYQPLYAALGLHPGMLEKHSDVSLDQLQQALERRPAKVVAVGRSVWISSATIRNLKAAVVTRRTTETGETLRSAGDPSFTAHARQTRDAS